MQKTTKLRLIGRYNLQGVPVLLLTFGFALGYEFLVVRPSKPKNNSESENANGKE